MSTHEEFINRAKELVQYAQYAVDFNDACICTFDLEALKYFYDDMSELFNTIQHSLNLGRRFY